MDVQQWITLLVALAATGYLIRRGVATLRGRRSGCHGCQDCSPPVETSAQLPVKQRLYTLPTNRRTDS